MQKKGKKEGRKKKQKQRDKQKAHVLLICKDRSVITINANGSKTPFKRQ